MKESIRSQVEKSMQRNKLYVLLARLVISMSLLNEYLEEIVNGRHVICRGVSMLELMYYTLEKTIHCLAFYRLNEHEWHLLTAIATEKPARYNFNVADTFIRGCNGLILMKWNLKRRLRNTVALLVQFCFIIWQNTIPTFVFMVFISNINGMEIASITQYHTFIKLLILSIIHSNNLKAP